MRWGERSAPAFPLTSPTHTLTHSLSYLLTGIGTTETEGGVMRFCAIKSEDTCDNVKDMTFTEFHVEDAEGELCYCKTDLCNAATQMTGHLPVIYIGVVSLIVLTTGHLLSH